jgi:hypothetical protein
MRNYTKNWNIILIMMKVERKILKEKILKTQEGKEKLREQRMNLRTTKKGHKVYYEERTFLSQCNGLQNRKGI